MQDLEKFAKLVSRWERAYVCVVRSNVSLKLPGGQRQLVHGKLLFEPSQFGIDQSPFEFETEHIYAARNVKELRPRDVSAIIERAKLGGMDAATSLTPNASFSPYLRTDYHPLTATLLINGENRQSIERQDGFPHHLGWEMKTADVPFDTLDELLEHCGLPAWELMRDATRLEIVAKPPGRIDSRSVIMNGNGVICCCVASALDQSKLKVGIRAIKKNREIIRESVKGDLFEWSVEGDLKMGKFEIDVGDSPFLDAYLSYDGIPIDEFSVSDPSKHLNPRYAINQLFDPKNDRLPQLLLNPEKEREKSFEGAVSMLLNLLGFSVSNYGRFPKFQDGPDIVAITPNGHVAIVECTVGLPNQNDKISKLVQRTQAIRKKLAAAGFGDRDIQPVLVTQLPAGEAAADVSAARDHGIALICKEHLEDALKQIELPLDAERFFRDFKKLIPPREGDALFGMLKLQ